MVLSKRNHESCTGLWKWYIALLKIYYSFTLTYMNPAKSNDRATRFNGLTDNELLQSWDSLALPDPRQHQLVITAGIVRLLEPAKNTSDYPVVTWSHTWDTWTNVRFSNSWAKLLVNGVWARGVGARVRRIIWLGSAPDASLEEAIRALVISLRYPILRFDQVKQEHRDLLAQHGFFE